MESIGEVLRRLMKQDSEGAWPETTRPSGAQSYAERISTAGWVVYALLEVEGQK